MIESTQEGEYENGEPEEPTEEELAAMIEVSLKLEEEMKQNEMKEYNEELQQAIKLSMEKEVISTLSIAER